MNKRGIATYFASAVLLAAVSNVQASTVYDFRSNGTSYTEVNGSGYGNGLDFGNMTATAWATTGVPTNNNSLIDSAQIHQWGTGLGSCNKEEGLAFGGCSTSTEHQVDNIGDDDYVLFLFDQTVQFDKIKINPFFSSDRDVSYWIGNISSASVMMGLDPADLDPSNTPPPSGSATINSTDFPFYNQKNFGSGSSVKTVNFANNAVGGNIGNALLFAARADAGNGYDNDYFKIRSLEVSTVVPVPAAVWLFGSGLLGLVGVARRKAS